MSKLSVIIPAYDQHELTTLHVKMIMRSTRLPDEVIVVNDGGADNLRDLLLAIDRKCPVIYAKIREDIPWNYTGARNLGVWLSTGDYISLEDTDHLPFPNVYEEAEKYLDSHPDVDRLVFHTRHKVYKDDALSHEPEDWTIIPPPRGTHYDLQIMRRLSYCRVKGFDERFAGKYAWSCTDWRRRMDMGGLFHEKLYVNYYVVLNGETNTLPRLRSKENYRLAQQRYENEIRHQSPHGILNFTYEFETL